VPTINSREPIGTARPGVHPTWSTSHFPYPKSIIKLKWVEHCVDDEACSIHGRLEVMSFPGRWRGLITNVRYDSLPAERIAIPGSTATSPQSRMVFRYSTS